jgi:hypothetical protein
MAVINIRSVQDAIGKGTLIDLGNDYRTSATVRSYLPRGTGYGCAISTAAYSQHVKAGTTGDQDSRMEAICSYLSKAIGGDGKPPQPKLEFKVPGEAGKGWTIPLRLEWSEPSKYWVIMLADEQLQAGAKSV